MNMPLFSQFHALRGEIKALAAGSWELFRQEMSGKLTQTRQQTLLMVAGALTALTAILLLLTSLTLLLSQLLVTEANWQPLLAGGCSALVIATIFALSGWLVFRNSGKRLKAVSLKPTQTLNSLKSAAVALTNRPLPPNPTNNPMNTQQAFQDTLHQTANTVEHQARRAGRAVAETTQSLSDKLDPGAFFSQVMTWVDGILTPQNRALAGRALTAVTAMPRRHPIPSLLLGVAGLCMVWRKAKGTTAREAVENYAAEQADKLRDLTAEAKSSANRSFRSAVASGRDAGSSFCQSASRVADHGRTVAQRVGHAANNTADQVRDVYEEARSSLTDGVDHLADSTRQLRKDAEAGYDKAKAFAKEEPALAIAGGVALAIGAFLLVRSSRR
jgi:ElaB/YqjD/DUF883 family membrane-anchored ribosome-binding protein